MNDEETHNNEAEHITHDVSAAQLLHVIAGLMDRVHALETLVFAQDEYLQNLYDRFGDTR